MTTHYRAGVTVALVRLVAAALVLAAVVVEPVFAAGAIAQDYKTDASGISQGALVSMASSGSNQVVLAIAGNASSLVGVAASNPVLQLSGSTGVSDIQVVVGGSTEVLVSDANGAVKSGDKIAASPLAGIGMKATAAGEVVGTAQETLAAVKTVTEPTKGKNGQNITVHVGMVPVAVNVVYYGGLASQGTVSDYVPPFLQTLANTVAGKAVSPLRVLIGAAALLLGFFAVTVMLYVGVRSGVLSLGRNPLAVDALRRGMVDVFIGAVGVLVVTGVIVAAVVLI